MREMRAVEAGDPKMLDHRIARKTARAQQDRLPEAVHLGEMRGPIVDASGEGRAEQRIGPDRGVKIVDEGRDKGFVDADDLCIGAPRRARGGGVGIRGSVRADRLHRVRLNNGISDTSYYRG